MKTKLIKMVRRAPEGGLWDEVTPGTLFVKEVESREEIGFGFWLVHDAEEKRWYAIDEASGLMAATSKSRRGCKDEFLKIDMKAHAARKSKGYESSCERLRILADPAAGRTWNPKRESREAFIARVAKQQEESAARVGAAREIAACLDERSPKERKEKE